MTTEAPNYEAPTFALSDDDRAALDLMKAKKAQDDLEKSRKQRLNDFINGEATKEYAKELLSHGLQADLDANPHLLDNTESLSYAANVALRNYKASLTSEESTPQPETQKQEAPAPLTPHAVVPELQTSQEHKNDIQWGQVSPDDLVKKHGFSKADAMLATAFPPNVFNQPN